MSEVAGQMGLDGKSGAATAGCLLAIDFGGTKIALATATPSGERLGEASRVLDATNRLGLPGGIDVHCHIAETTS
ncbi:hypothetical protein F3J16_25750, partial [Burkholderia sp. Ap-962]|nr:hypothetical protein [Burkholderia sp. Ap-962]